MTDRERIEQALAAEAVKANRERLYAFNDAQIAAFEVLGIRMVPVNEKRIIAGVLEDAEAAGYAWYRPDDCVAIAYLRTQDDGSLAITEGTYRLVPVGGEG